MLKAESGQTTCLEISCIMTNPALYICENKGADQLWVTGQLISAFVFAT